MPSSSDEKKLFYKRLFQSDTEESASSFIVFSLEFFIQALLGALIGAAIDNFVRNISNEINYVLEKRRTGQDERGRRTLRTRILFISALIQIFLNIIITWLMMFMAPIKLYQQWQSTMSGLAFPAIFWGVQINFFNNIRQIF